MRDRRSDLPHIFSDRLRLRQRILAALYVLILCAVNAYGLHHSATLTHRLLQRDEFARRVLSYERARGAIEEERRALDEALARTRPDAEADLGPRERAVANELYEREVARADLRRSELDAALRANARPTPPTLPQMAFLCALVAQVVLMCAPWALSTSVAHQKTLPVRGGRRSVIQCVVAACTDMTLKIPSRRAVPPPASQEEAPARVPAMQARHETSSPPVTLTDPAPPASRVTKPPFSRHAPRSKLTEVMRERMRALRSANWTNRKIALETGVSRQTVWRHLQIEPTQPGDDRHA